MKAKNYFSIIALNCICLLTYGQNLEIYVSDAGGFNSPPWQILKFDGNGENPEIFIEDSLGWPQDILFLEDQEVVLISNLSSGEINRHSADDGTYIDQFAAVTGGPTRMAIGADELIYVLQWSGNGSVLRFDQNGNFVDEFTDLGVNQSIGMAWDEEGRLYISSYGGDLVERFNSDGTSDGTFIETNLAGPTNIWFEENGNLLVSDYNAGSIKRFDSDGDFMGVYIPSLSQPEGIAYLPSGELLIGNGGTGEVKRFDDEGMFIDDFIPSGTNPGLVTPNAVVVRSLNTSLDSGFEQDQNFIVPSIGQTFYISSEMSQNITSMSVFSSTGHEIDNLPVTDDVVWDASSRNDGFYIINATLSDGLVLKQKVMVQVRH